MRTDGPEAMAGIDASKVDTQEVTADANAMLRLGLVLQRVLGGWRAGFRIPRIPHDELNLNTQRAQAGCHPCSRQFEVD